MSTLTAPHASSPLARSLGALSLQAKLLALALALLSVVLLSTIVTNLSALRQFEEHVSHTSLEEESSLLAARFRAEREELKALALAITLDSELLAAIRAGDLVGVQRHALQLEVRHQLDELAIVGAQGQTLFGGEQQGASAQEALALALHTIEQNAVAAAPEGWMLVAAVPIKDNAGVQGALLAGRRMDDAFLRRLNSDRADPVLRLHAAPDSIVAASAADELDAGAGARLSQEQWLRVLGGEPVETPMTTPAGGSYHVLYAPLAAGEASSPVYSIAVSTAEIEALRASMINQSIAVLVGVGLIALGLLFLTIRQLITRPLAGLTEAAEQLGAGNLHVQLQATGRDEVGRLTESFRAMVRQLRQSFAELEERNSLLQHEIAERRRSEETRAQLQEEVTLAQRTILDMATPLIPIDSRTVVMPLVGLLDTERAQQILSTLLKGVEHTRASVAIIDITGVPVVDTQVARILLMATRAVRLVGARVVLSGIRPEVAQSIVGLGIDTEALSTYASLEQAIRGTRRG